jgi:Xaa-Pro aminopeptidase
MNVPLPDVEPMDLPSRTERLRSALPGLGVDAVLVTKAANVRWLTGFTGSNGQLLITDDRLVAVTDGRYRKQISDQLDAAGVQATIEITTTETAAILGRELPATARLGLEATHVTWAYRDKIDSWLPGRELVALDAPIEQLRKVKDRGERSRLARAAAMADAALAAVEPDLGQLPTEREVALRLDALMIGLGADEPSYDTIVASGPNAALPHAHPTDRVIGAGDTLIIDVGARLDGYGSDMTRTFVIGDTVGDEQQRWYDAVAEAQEAGVAAVADGVEERAIDLACREVLDEHGLVDAFIHGTGHGIGLEIHEDPILSPRSTGILQAGYVVTVEPGVYFPNQGGVRIEDAVVVTDDGCQPITNSPKRITPDPASTT